jgi:hypothetical protein
MTKKMRYALWAVQILLALLFLFAGSAKLALPVETLTKQMPLPGWFVRFIGVAEVLGALGLVLPGLLRVKQSLTPVAAAGLAVIMAGATMLTFAHGGAAAAWGPLVVGLLTVFVVYGHTATKPDSFRVERSTSVQAPPEKLFELIGDFHRWGSWSPWEKLDPAMKKTYSGAASGPGAVYAWAGNGKAGEGRMEIVSAVPYSRIAIKLDFLKPFEGHNTAEFTMDPKAGATKVTWAMYGPQSYMLKVMSLFFSMDAMVGKDFEEGLAKMKAIAENQTVYSN